jgi:CRISPR-associated protein Cas2
MRNIYIITYDITDNKRRTRVYKKLRGVGEAIQYSVFQCSLDKRELLHLKADLWEMLNLKEDRLVVIDVGPQDGRGPLALDSWGKSLEEPADPNTPMIF